MEQFRQIKAAERKLDLLREQRKVISKQVENLKRERAALAESNQRLLETNQGLVETNERLAREGDALRTEKSRLQQMIEMNIMWYNQLREALQDMIQRVAKLGE